MIDLSTNNPLNPSTPGFQSGTYSDGSVVFPGTGFFSNSYGNHVARISLTSQNGSGAYSSAYDYKDPIGKELFNATGAKYFYADPDLVWVPVRKTDANKVPNAVRVFTFLFYQLYVIRVNLTNEEKVYQQIGYYRPYSGLIGIWNGIEEEKVFTHFEVLSCAGSSWTSSFTTQPTNFACGSLLSIK